MASLLSTFGFELVRAEQDDAVVRSPVPAANEEGAIESFTTTAGMFGRYMSLDGTNVSNENTLIMKYREAAGNPEIAQAVEEICNSIINANDVDNLPISLNLDNTDLTLSSQKILIEEWKQVMRLFNIKKNGFDIARRWYVDGRINYHKMIDETAPEKGILELRYIDPRKIKKIIEISQDTNTRASSYTELNVKTAEYFIYSEVGVDTGMNSTVYGATGSIGLQGLRMSADSVAHCNSGLLDATGKTILSYLHEAIRPMNLLRMLEDGAIIYRISRAPERRVFNVDVGNLQRAKADEFMQQLMNKFKTKLVFDSASGEIKDDRKHFAITEDFWLPKRDGRGVEIDTLPGGNAQGIVEEIDAMKAKLSRSLHVPVGRLDPNATVQFGRTATEVTREELRFAKFVRRLRSRLSELFLDVFRTQLHLKGIMTYDEFEEIRDEIIMDYSEENIFEELKEMELHGMRFDALNNIRDHIGTFISQAWVDRNILKISEEEREEIKKEIAKEKPLPPIEPSPFDDQGETPFAPEPAVPQKDDTEDEKIGESRRLSESLERILKKTRK